MNRPALLVPILLLIALPNVRAGGDLETQFAVPRQPLSKVAALNLAIAQNGTILQAQKDVEAVAGVAVQTRAILYPQVTQTAMYSVSQDSLIEANETRELPTKEINIPGIGSFEVGGGTTPKVNNQVWDAQIQITQSLYEGGRLLSAVRTSKLLREQSFLTYEAVVADTLLDVSNAYDDVLSTARQIDVRQASVKLLSAYLNDTQARFNAGTVTKFDVLREQVEVANEQASLVQAIGANRVAKQTFVELLGCDLPTSVGDDLPLDLTSPLEAIPYSKELSVALAEALMDRPEIAALAKEILLRNEDIIVARAHYKPSVQAFAGYEVASRLQTRSANEEVHGGLIGVQLSWSIFDGFLTKGQVDQATALHGKAIEAEAETKRIVELQVRSAWSDLRTARAVLDAEAQNVNKAVEALDLIRIRYQEGSGTQVEVLSAQTALTDARATFVQGLRDYSVARSRLLRATGADLKQLP